MIIRREALQAVLGVTDTSDTRFYMQGVQVDPAKHAVIATDGHVLLVATDTAPFADADFPQVRTGFHGNPDKPIVLPADVAKSMIATMPKRPTIEILAACQLSTNGTPGTVTVSATDLQAPRTATIKLDEQGRFPAWERVIPPTDRPEVRLVLAVDVLEDVIKAAKAVAGKGKAVIHFGVPTGAPQVAEAVRISTGTGAIQVTGCAMPCRV